MTLGLLAESHSSRRKSLPTYTIYTIHLYMPMLQHCIPTMLWEGPEATSFSCLPPQEAQFLFPLREQHGTVPHLGGGWEEVREV